MIFEDRILWLRNLYPVISFIYLQLSILLLYMIAEVISDRPYILKSFKEKLISMTWQQPNLDWTFLCKFDATIITKNILF